MRRNDAQTPVATGVCASFRRIFIAGAYLAACHFPLRIARARRQARLTQAEVAERLGWTRDSYAHYEYGRRSPQLDRLAAIAATLGVPLAVLVTDDDDLAALTMRIAARRDLASHVSFFLDTLDDAPPTPPPGQRRSDASK